MGNGESRDGFCQLPDIADQEHQCEDEEQVIQTGEDMVNSQKKVGCCHLQTGLNTGNRKGWRARPKPGNLCGTAEILDPNQHISHAVPQPIDGNRLALQPIGA